MSMVAESVKVPLFIGGVCIVSLLELIIGCCFLKKEKKTIPLFIGNVISMAIAMVYLILCVFGNRLGFVRVGDSASNSVNIGLFGVFWTLSVVFLLAILNKKEK